MKNTKSYFFNVTGFIDDMAEIWQRYDSEAKRLEKYRGSEGYNAGMKRAEAERDEAVKEMRNTYRKRFADTISKMKDALDHRPIVFPTQEQAAMLSVLQMRETLTRDELDRTADQMAGCPVALSVLDDLAKKHKIIHGRYNQELDPGWFSEKVATLERKANELLQAGVDAAGRRKPEDVVSCMEQYGVFWPIKKDVASGGLNNTQTDVAKIEYFSTAVDGE